MRSQSEVHPGKIRELHEKKALYQRRYLDGVRRRANEAIHLNETGELLSLDMVFVPSADQLANAERDPVTALMTLACNSGLGRFPGTSGLLENWEAVAQLCTDEEHVPPYITEIKAEIQRNFTDSDSGRIVDDFLQRFHLDASLLACGSCGKKSYSLGTVHHHSVPLSKLSSLKMSSEDLATLLALPAEYRYILQQHFERNHELTILLFNYFHAHDSSVLDRLQAFTWRQTAPITTSIQSL